MKKLLLIALSMCVMVSVSYAQEGSGEPKKERKEKRLSAEEKAEMREYYETKVYPVKKAAYDKMMASLSGEDREFLMSKQAEKKSLKEQMRAAKKEIRQLEQSGADEATVKAKRKEVKKPINQQYKELKKLMQPFIERNMKLIESQFASIKDNKDLWTYDREKMLDEFLSDKAKEKRDAKQKAKSEKQAANPEKAAERAEKREKRRMLNFVLWDGEMKPVKQGKKRGGKKSKK